MKLDFIFYNVLWLLIGLAASKVVRWVRTRVRRRRLRAFFGADALANSGIVVTIPVLRPLSRDNFDPNPEVTMAVKTDEAGNEVRRPIYGEVLHLADYDSTDEILALLRELGAKNLEVMQDSKSLGKWIEKPCVVCLGSPFVNATFGELLTLADDAGGAPIYGNRTSPTLDTYRLTVREPESLNLGVDDDHLVGVIARLANPAKPTNWVIGVWGDRAESTYGTARYFRSNFKEVSRLADPRQPLIVLLAIRGQEHNVCTVMFAATDKVLLRDNELLKLYLRSDGPSDPTGR